MRIDQTAAFATSYAAKADYADAIAPIKATYTGTYEQNLRLGWLYFLAKNYTAAVAHYRKAMEQRPYDLEPKFGLIKPLSALGQIEKMLNTYESILKIDPRTPRPITGPASSTSTAKPTPQPPATSSALSTCIRSTTIPPYRWLGSTSTLERKPKPAPSTPRPWRCRHRWPQAAVSLIRHEPHSGNGNFFTFLRPTSILVTDAAPGLIKSLKPYKMGLPEVEYKPNPQE
jgi:tetratricopeptide (TPR) repeat protein